MNAQISATEIRKAIQLLQAGKTPGSDGFGSEFYKEFQNLLIELMICLITLGCGTLPASLREGNISLLLKMGKCPEECASYRPISLLNVDLKIPSKILVICLEGLLPFIVKEDQTGFIKGHNSHHNIGRLLNISQLSQHRAVDDLVVSLDGIIFKFHGWAESRF